VHVQFQPLSSEVLAQEDQVFRFAKMNRENEKGYGRPTGAQATDTRSNSAPRPLSVVSTIPSRMRWLVGLGAVLVIGAVSIVRAGLYYVDVDGGSNSNTGLSPDTAWKHLPGTEGQSGSGWVTFQDGDVVYVKGGTTNFVQVKFTTSYYHGNTNFDSIQVISGHLANPPWGSGRAVFDEANTNTFGFWIAAGGNCNGLTIDGFEVRNIAPGGVGAEFDSARGSCCIVVGGNYTALSCKIRHCYLHDALRATDDEGHGIETNGRTGSRDLIIEYNQIGPRIGLKGIEVDRHSYGIIRNNCVTDTQEHGIVVTGQHWDIYNNVVCMVPPYNTDPTYAMKLNDGYNDVWNNILCQQDTPDPTPINQRANGFGIFHASSSNRFYHNTIYNFANTLNGREYGAGIAIGSERGIGRNNDIQNNIVYRCRNENGGIQLFVYSAATNNTIRYNDLFYTNATDRIIDFGNAFYLASQLNIANAVNGLMRANRESPPNFVEGKLPDGLDLSFHPNTDFFKLTSRSDPNLRYTMNVLKPASSNGYTDSPEKFSADILGNPRVLWSMGAYEFVGPIASPTNLRIIQVQ
jgi:hypothetical protein